MPIYEYRCQACQRKISIFFRTLNSSTTPTCPNCGSMQLDRLFSRVVLRRGAAPISSDMSEPYLDPGFKDAAGSYDDLTYGDDSYSDPFGAGDDADPRELAAWTRQMSEQIGETLDPDLDRALTDLERGADPDEVMDQLEQSDPETWDSSDQ